MCNWINITEQLPPENIDVLVCTDMKKMKVVSLRNGIFNTYMKVVAWQQLPDFPSFNDDDSVKKRRGRPKKA